MGKWEMQTLQVSFPWFGERQWTGAFREGMCTMGGALCLNTVRERPVAGEDGSGTGHHREGVRREGSRRHKGQQQSTLAWHHCCKGGAEAWGERRGLQVASQN